MKSRMYCIRDRKSGLYGTPFVSFNDETAKRDFNVFCRQPSQEFLADDYELYYLGTLDSKTGCFEDIPAHPEFLCVKEVK